jgi:hypothetical protein
LRSDNQELPMIKTRLLAWIAACAATIVWPIASSAQPGLPGAPSNFQVTVSGTTLSLTWGAPTTGAAPTNYRLVARTTTGTVITTQNVWPTPAFVAAVPNGIYVLTVQAQNAVGFGPETAPQTVTVPGAPPGGPAAPGAPTNLQAVVSGTTLSITWSAPSSGGAPSNYTLIARTQAGAILAQQNVWPTPAFVAAVPNGVYVLTVRASNASGAGPETAPVTVTVPSAPAPGPGVPGVPTNLQATVSGNTLSMSWGPPTSGGAVVSYTVIGRTTLGAVVATQNVGNTTTFVAAVPNGGYVLSVQAVNGNGAGPETAPRTVSVPEAVQPPGTPQGLSATASGASVTFAWSPPGSGGPVQAYVLMASLTPGGAPIATLSIAGNVLQTVVPGVPPGTYYARVVATNTAGSSLASNTASVTVGAPSTSRSTLNPPGVPSSIQAFTSQIYGNGGSPVQMFDDFTFAGGSTIRQIAWQGMYCTPQNNSPAPAATATAFVVSIYPDQAGRPNTAAPLASATLSTAQVNQTSNGTFVGATCDAASNTSWSLYSYQVALPTGFTAAPGARYWFSVQAVTPTSSVTWGWRRGTTDNQSALQFYQGTFYPTTLDRAFALAP